MTDMLPDVVNLDQGAAEQQSPSRACAAQADVPLKRCPERVANSSFQCSFKLSRHRDRFRDRASGLPKRRFQKRNDNPTLPSTELLRSAMKNDLSSETLFTSIE